MNFPRREDYGLTTFRASTTLRGLEPALSIVEGSRLSAGGAPSAMGELGAPTPDPLRPGAEGPRALPFGPSLYGLAVPFARGHLGGNLVAAGIVTIGLPVKDAIRQSLS